MRYIKTYETFDVKKENQPLEITSDMNAFNDNEKWIAEFNSKKNSLMQIYATYKDDGKDIISVDLYNKLLSGKFINTSNDKTKISFINPLFGIYSEFCKKSRELKNTNTSLEQKKNSISSIQTNINNGEGDKEIENNDIKAATNDIKTMTDKLTQINKEISDLQNSSNQQIQTKIKELQASQKRIKDVKSV